MSHLPNALTAGRIVAVPVFLWCFFTGRADAALWLLLGASVTDVVDGLLARALRAESELGRWLDPLADKLIVFAGFVALTVPGDASFPTWFTALVLGRDAAIVAGIGLLRLAGRKLVIDPTRLSKYATFFQLVTLVVALAHRSAGRPPEMAPYVRAVAALCAMFVLVSVTQYAWRGVRIWRGR